MIRDTVKFSGTASSDGDALFVIVAQDPVETQRAISEQIALLLATQFEAAPHPVGKRFRKGAMRTLNAPATGSALAFPLGISGEPVGPIQSIENVLLAGWDMALSIRSDVIMGLAQPLLDQINSYRPTIGVHIDTSWPVPDIDTVYRVQVGITGFEWLP